MKGKSRIPNLTHEKERIQDLAGKGRPSGTLNPKPRKTVKTCVTNLYETVSEVYDSDLTTHDTVRFTEEDDCEDDVDCLNQPLEPDDFVLVKFAIKKTVRLIQ